MPRRGGYPKGRLFLIPFTMTRWSTRFINKIDAGLGKRAWRRRFFIIHLKYIREKTGKEPLELFHQALKNVMPVLEVRPRRVGGATYQVPMEVRPERRVSLAMRWLLAPPGHAGKNDEGEVGCGIDGRCQQYGTSIKKKEDTHRMAEANKAFAHYRW